MFMHIFFYGSEWTLKKHVGVIGDEVDETQEVTDFSFFQPSKKTVQGSHTAASPALEQPPERSNGSHW